MNEVQENVLGYVLGGKAEFTLEQEGVAQVKYKVTSNDNGSCYFVSTEKPNSKELSYQGYVVKRTMLFCKAKNMPDSELNTKAINAFIWLLKHGNNMPKNVHVYHNGRCSRCGRKLTDAESLRTGLGPTCRSKKINP